MKNLLSVSTDSKTVKGEKFGYLTGVLYLAPSNISGFNTCPMASDGCKKACLYSAGRGRFSNVQQSRINKTLLYFNDRTSFMSLLEKNIVSLKNKALKMGLIPVIRLNGTSDILGHDYLELILKHSDIQFYDYTKVFNRFSKDLPKNYSLTFSRSETNQLECIEILKNGHNVAIVFETKNGQLPIFWNGYSVIDGDLSDLRFNDDIGVVVGLKSKGLAKKDLSNFVVKNTDKECFFMDDIKTNEEV